MTFLMRVLVMTILFPAVALAAQSGTATTAGLGALADTFVEPVNTVTSFVSTSCFIIGGTCLFSGFMRYLQYRVNPLANPLSTVVTLFILGALLILFPFLFEIITADM